jgi:hypothetical protein
LVVEAEPEEAVALVLADNLQYLNRYGERFKTVESGERPDLPIITARRPADAESCSVLAAAVEIVEAVEAGGSAGSLNELSEVHLDTAGEAALFFRGLPAPVKVPFPHPVWDRESLAEAGAERVRQFSRRVEGFRRVAEHLTRSGRIHEVSRIDVSQDDGIVVTYRNG